MSLFSSLVNTTHRKWWILFAMSISLGMTLIDQTAVAIAIPKIQQAFKLSNGQLQWIMNAYILVLAVFLSIGGCLGDQYLHHRVFLAGLLIFLFASITCGLAPNITCLITSRAIQGFGAALILPNSAVLIMSAFEPSEKGKAMGIYLGSALLFLPIALLMGGFFTQFLSWRLIFLINIPLCIVCFSITFYLIRSIPVIKVKKKLDWSGFIILAIALSSFVFALMEINYLDQSISIALFLMSILFFIMYYYHVLRSKNPIVDFRIFNNKLLLCSSLLTFSMSILTSIFVFDAIFYQEVLGYKPAITGLLFLPSILCVMIAAPIAGKIFDRYGYRLPVMIGLLLILLGLFANATLLHYQNYWYLLPGLICINVGSPFVSSPINTAALSSVEELKRGAVSGILNTVRQVSNSIHLALFTAIIIGTNRYFLKKFISENHVLDQNVSVAGLENLLTHPYSTTATTLFSQEQLTSLYVNIKMFYTLAYSISLYLAALIMILTLFCTIKLFRMKDDTSDSRV